MKESKSVTLTGTKKGAVTSVAIMLPPLGKASSIGCANNEYMSLAHGK
jgi:hypothetical protein